MVCKALTYDSFRGFLNDYLFNDEGAGEIRNGYIFRGEDSDTYDLLPSALRESNREELWFGLGKPSEEEWEQEGEQVSAESWAISNFFKNANDNGLVVPEIESLFSNYSDPNALYMKIIQNNDSWPNKEIEQIASLAQHYGVLTRFLDWTYSINVALYFASIGYIGKRVKDADSISGNNIVIWALNETYTEVTRKWTGNHCIHLITPPYAGNPNLCAQKGVLSYWDDTKEGIGIKEKLKLKINRKPLDQRLEEYYKDEIPEGVVVLYRVEIPQNEAGHIYEYVDSNGVNGSTLFPGYAGVTKYIDELRSLNKFKELLHLQNDRV